jgi:hypothetical protein
MNCAKVKFWAIEWLISLSIASVVGAITYGILYTALIHYTGV